MALRLVVCDLKHLENMRNRKITMIGAWFDVPEQF